MVYQPASRFAHAPLRTNMENVAVAAICFSIAAFYTALILWQWQRRRKNG